MSSSFSVLEKMESDITLNLLFALMKYSMRIQKQEIIFVLRVSAELSK